MIKPSEPLNFQVIEHEIRHSENVTSKNAMAEFFEIRFKILNLTTREQSHTPWYGLPAASAQSVPLAWLEYMSEIKSKKRSIN